MFLSIKIREFESSFGNSSYSHNGKTQEYKKGQILTIDGKYEITLYDEIGNFTTVNFFVNREREED